MYSSRPYMLIVHSASYTFKCLFVQWVVIKSYTLTEHRPVTIATALAQGDAIQLLVTELRNTTIPSEHKADVSNTTILSEHKADIAKCTWYKLKFSSNIESFEHSVDVLRSSIGEIVQVMAFRSKSLPLYAVFQACPSLSTHYLLYMSETTPTISQAVQQPSEDKADITDTVRHFGLGYSKHNWSQPDADVIVTFDLPSGVTKRDIYCVISRQELVVGLTDGTTLLRGELYAPIHTEGSTWTIAGDK